MQFSRAKVVLSYPGWGGGVFDFMHGGSRRVNPSNEGVTGRRYGKMTGWTKGRREGVLDMELKLVWGTAYIIPGIS